MERLSKTLLVLFAGWLVLTGCADITDETIEESYAHLEEHGITDDRVIATTIAGNGSVVATVIAEDGCIVKVADDGEKLAIVNVAGVTAGYPIDLDEQALTQFADLCQYPADINRVAVW
jgi:hypothetical protein